MEQLFLHQSSFTQRRVAFTNRSIIRSVLFATFGLLFFTLSAQAQISGAIFRDFNGNGTKDATEPLIPGITVQAYNTAGALCGSVVSVSSTGATNYTLTGCGTGDVRVEFTINPVGVCIDPAFDQNALGGNQYGSSVQFVKGNSTNVNFALYDANDYAPGTAGVSVYVPCYVNGDPLPSGSASGASDWFVGFLYTNTGTTNPAQKLNGAIIGSTWGVAYSKQARKIFTSAFLKRHVGLGTLGSGGIYMLTPTPTSFSVVSFYDMDANGHRTRAASSAVAYGSPTSFTINTAGTIATFQGPIDPLTGQPEGLGVIGVNGTGGRALPTVLNSPSYDPAAFDQTGKVGLGDIEISDDGRFLFVMNLYSRQLFRLELNDPVNPTSVVNVTSFPIPTVSCTNGVLRPFAVKFHRDKVYIGAVCSGENGGTNTINNSYSSSGTADLQAYVYRFDNPTQATAAFDATPVISFPLNYRKGSADGGTSNQWYPWTNQAGTNPVDDRARPSPILSNIDFSDRGDLLLNFMDRHGNQFGYENRRFLNSTNTSFIDATIGGDLLVAGVNCNGIYTLENNARITSINGPITTSGDNNQQGPGSPQANTGEFFTAENNLHAESSMGAFAPFPGRDEFIFTMMDPLVVWSGGVRIASTTTGQDKASYELYRGAGFGGKANGLGDLELSASFAPVEIGNRVWIDANQNGIQDAGERPVAGAEVRLYNTTKTNLLATAITDANGEYYFTSSTSATGLTASYVSTTALQPNTSYALVVAGLGNSGFSVTAVSPLTPGETGSANSGTTTTNNDARLDNVGGQQLPCITFTTGPTGSVNHNYDFGFLCVPQPTLIATASQSVCQGSTRILSVDGIPEMTFQWFVGSTTNPVASTAQALTTTAINSQTTYIVRGSILGCTTTETPVVLTPVACQTCTVAPTTIGGTVFRDFNSDGIDAVNDLGIAGITVTIFRCDANGTSTQVGQTQTDLNGNYNFTGLTAGVSHRVEFSNYPAGYQPTYRGTNNGTSAQFVLPGTCNASLGLNRPIDYCQANPTLVVPCHVNGGNTAGSPNDALVRFNYDETGKAIIATTAQIGTTWGLAYAKTTRKVYTGAFLKRHSAMGPSGAGAIYITDLTSATTTTFFNLSVIEGAGIVPNNTTRGLTAAATAGIPNTDPQAFSLVGTVGLGDVDISEDDQFLYTISLASKRLYRIPTTNPTAGNSTSWTIPDPGCTGGQWRPFALKVNGDKLYVGGICDASTTPVTYSSVASMEAARENLRAVVYEFDPTGGTFTQKLNFPLNFTRGSASPFACTTPAEFEKAVHWNPWISNHRQNGTFVFSDCGIHDVYPQPVLSDIEIDVDGSLILAFLDRWGHQTGEATNYPDGVFGEQGVTGGDIMRADFNGGNFLLENNGIVGQLAVGGTTAQQNYNNGSGTARTPEGQGRGGREFYFGDTWQLTHDEKGMGSVALLPGSGEVVMTAMDAADVIYSGGVIWLNNTTGLANDAFTLYSGGIASFGKGYALGDIELVCNIAPIQIGNRVWRDDNRNGIQDPCEPPIPGAVVQLYNAAKTTLIASATTNAAGEYYFMSGTTVAGTSTSAVTTTALQANTTYGLVISNLGTGTAVTSQGLALTDVSPLTPGESGTGNSGATINNNDAKVDAGRPCIMLTTGDAGENNHTYDFGIAKVVCSLTVTAQTSTGSTSFCQGQPVTLVASASATPAGSYTYTWAAPPGVVLTGPNTATATASSLTAGSYSFTVTASSGPTCQTTATVSVTINPLPTLSVSDAGCTSGGESATVLVSTNATAFVVSAGTASPVAGGFLVTVPNTVSTFTASVTSAAGCTNSLVVNVPQCQTSCPPLSVSASLNQPSACAGQSVTLTASASPAGSYSYSWAGPQGITFTPSANVSSVTTSELPAGQHVFTVTVTSQPGCFTTAQVSVTVNNPPSLSVVNPVICLGESVDWCTDVVSEREDGSNTQLFGSLTDAEAFRNPLNVTCILSPTATTAYFVGTQSQNGCVTATSFTITVTPAPVIALTPASQTVCIDGSSPQLISASITSGTATAFQWYGPTSSTATVLSASLTDETSSTLSVSNYLDDSPGTFYFAVVTQNGPVSCSTVAYASVVVNNRPDLIQLPSQVCAGQPIDILTSFSIANGPAQVKVYATREDADAGVNSLTSTIVSLSANTTFYVNMTNTVGCTWRDATNITVTPTPNAGSNQTLVCADGVAPTSAVLTFSPSGGSWSGVAGNPAPVSFMTMPASATANGLSVPGTYTLVYTVNGCSDEVLVTVPVCQTVCSLTATAQASSQTVAQGQSVTLSASVSPTGSYTYAWSGPIGVTFNPTDAATVTTSALNTTGIQTFTVTVTSSPGCSTTATVSIDVRPTPGPTIAIIDPCQCFRVEYDLDEKRELFEVVEIRATPGQSWSVLTQTGMLELDSLVKTPLAAGTSFTEVSPGVYQLEFTHEDGIGYSLTATNGTDQLSISNLCRKYPDITTTVLSQTLCRTAAPVALTATTNLPSTARFFYVDQTTNQRVFITQFDPSQFTEGQTISVLLDVQPTDTSLCRTLLVQKVVIDSTDCPCKPVCLPVSVRRIR